MASTQSDQFAAEFKELKHGVFTYAVLQGLNGAAEVHKATAKSPCANSQPIWTTNFRN